MSIGARERAPSRETPRMADDQSEVEEVDLLVWGAALPHNEASTPAKEEQLGNNDDEEEVKEQKQAIGAHHCNRGDGGIICAGQKRRTKSEGDCSATEVLLRVEEKRTRYAMILTMIAGMSYDE